MRRILTAIVLLLSAWGVVWIVGRREPQASETRAEGQAVPGHSKTEVAPTAALSPASADAQEIRSVAVKQTDTSKDDGTTAAPGRVAHGRRIAGRVVFEDSKKPCAGAQVRIDPKIDGADFTEDSADTRTTESDPAGAFAFDSIPPGSYSVSASLGSRLSVERTVNVPENGTQEDLELRLAAPSYIHGRLIGLEGAVFDGMRIFAQLTEDPDEAPNIPSANELPQDAAGVVANDGTFRDGPVPAGEYRILLCVPSVAGSSGHGSTLVTAGEPLSLGAVTLPPNSDIYREFDIRNIFPGHVRVQGAVNGSPADNAIITIEDTTTHDFAGALMLNATGIGESAPLKPGTYRVVAGAADRSWVYLLPGVRVLKPGEVVEFDFDVHLLPGVLQVRDAKTGGVLSNEAIELSLDDDGEHGQSVIVTTDQDGAARLNLPKARYRVQTGNASGGTGTTSVEWGDSGPTPAEVAVYQSGSSK